MKKKMLSAVISICMIISLLPAMSLTVSADDTATGTMTELYTSVVVNGGATPSEGRYSIATAEELEYLAEYTNAGNNTSGVTFFLTADIALGYWQDDSDGVVEEGEIFDAETGGAAYSTSNWAPIGGFYSGSYKFFEGVFDGCGNTVSGLYLDSSNGRRGLFGFASNAEIRNLGVTDSFITASQTAGAVAAYCYNCMITNCYNSGTVDSVAGQNGGVIGKIGGNFTVSECYNTGTVSCTDDSNGKCVGGVVGEINRGSGSTDAGLVDNCYNLGNITTADGWAGGVVGKIGSYGSTVQYCHNAGSVSGENNRTGGIVGFDDCSIGEIQYCRNEGSVSGGSEIGGIIGYNEGIVRYCYNTVLIDGNGSSRIGGIAGYNSRTVSYCYNTGTIVGSYVGGIVGYNDSSQKVSYCYNNGYIDGGNNGGIVGYLYKGYVDYCYNASRIDKSSYCGGLAGSKRIGSGIGVRYSFYDKQISYAEGGVKGSDSSGARGMLTTQMIGDTLKTADAGIGWTGDYWVFEDGLYPRLKDLDTTDSFDLNGTDEALLMAVPVIFSGTGNDCDTVAEVTSDFTVCTYSNQIAWQSSAADRIAIAGENAEIKGSGHNVILTATKGAATKTVKITTVTLTLSSDAGLASVLSKTDATPGAESGVDSDHAVRWEIEVASGISELSLTDIESAADATFHLYSDSAFSSEITGLNKLDLTEGGITAAYIKVIAQNGTTVFYAVAITRESAPSSDAGLISVFSKSDSDTTGSGMIADPVLWEIEVPNNVSELSLSRLKAAADASVNLFSDNVFSSEITGAGTLALLEDDTITAYIKVTAQDTTTTMYYAVAITRAGPPSSDASLVSVFSQADTDITGLGTRDDPILWQISVPNDTDSVFPSCIEVAEGAQAQMVKEDLSTPVTDDAPFALAAGKTETVYIGVQAEDGSTALLYKVEITRAAASSGHSGSNHSSNKPARANSVEIYVNGERESAGTTETKTENGREKTTVTVNSDKLADIFASEDTGSTVRIPIKDGADTASGVLTGRMVKDMEKKDATLVVETESATYTLPAEQIDIGEVAKQFGNSIDLSDIQVEVTISEPDKSTVQVIEDLAGKDGFTLMVQPVDFTVKCTYDGQNKEVLTYNTYVERTIVIPDGVDPNKITTAVVVEPDGTVRHVPTQIEVIDGIYYAVIKSLTNSVYTLINHSIEFEDMEGHWAENSVNDMAKRRVITGYADGTYHPDGTITRAEFAAIVVRALGLAPGSGESSFDDVGASSWYSGFVETATQYGIINGCGDSIFRPNDLITREQAMTILARAMQITELEIEDLSDSSITALLENFPDGSAVSDYAQHGVVACLKNGIVTGKTSVLIASKDTVTRAEVAAMVQRLLQKSDLT